MPELSAWCHLIGQNTGAFAAAIDALAAGHIDVRGGYETATLCQFGLVFFNELKDTLFDFLREVSSNGMRRVLALALPPCKFTVKEGVALIKSGAADVMRWTQPSEAIEAIKARLDRWKTVDEVIDAPIVRENLAGSSAEWLRAMRQLIEAAKFSDAPVMLIGETGTGKELAARLIHALSSRYPAGGIVTVDCTTVSPELAGSEFFGHERGAFTGAVGTRDGAFALANGGTLFLDEMGELPLPLQAQLLRVIQEHTYKRVGGNSWYSTDFRPICATNRELGEEVRFGRFRADLLHRLNGWTIRLPALSDRRDDILSLAKHFLRESRPQEPIPEFDESMIEYLMTREYAGNVRELKLMIGRINYRHVGPGPFTIGDLSDEDRTVHCWSGWQDGDFEKAVERAVMQGVELGEIGRVAKETAIRIAVQREDGNLQRAARRLGVTDRALQIRRARWASAS